MRLFDRERFDAAKKALNLSNERLGHAIGRTGGYVTQIAAGHVPSRETQDAIAGVLNVSAADLWPTIPMGAARANG